VKRNLDDYGLGFYEVYSSHNTLIGIGAFFISTSKSYIYPEISVYILPEHQNKKFGSSIAIALINHAFATTLTSKVVADAYRRNVRSTAALKTLGFIQRKAERQYTHGKYKDQIRYKLYRKEWGLKQLSDIIINDTKQFIPKPYDFAGDVARFLRLWYTYFSTGIFLSTGGVNQSFVTLEDLKGNENTTSYNMYRSDRIQQYVIKSADIIKFLREENMISDSTNSKQLVGCFALGTHEGYSRLMRCIRRNQNRELLFPTGSYGPFAMLAANMKPVGYKVTLIRKRANSGEKIDIDHLETLTWQRKHAKTLYLDLRTVAGAVYSHQEVKKIIAICKAANIFIVLDMAHANMEFYDNARFPDVFSLLQQANHHQYAVLYSTSKTFGLERARLGFVVFSATHKNDLVGTFQRDLYRVIGAGNDIPFEVARVLFESPITKRMEFHHALRDYHYYNMHLQIAYLEGIDSPTIDSRLRQQLRQDIPFSYHQGISTLNIVFIPENGLQMKVSMQALSQHYLANLRMFNAEMFTYALQKCHAVIVLPAVAFCDSDPFLMRISFSDRQSIHSGMQGITHFVRSLNSTPSFNKYMPSIVNAESYILDKPKKSYATTPIEDASSLYQNYIKNVKKQAPACLALSREDCEKSIHNAATIIQRFWRYRNNTKQKHQRALPCDSTRIMSKL
ncbi:MAG: aminotransferase class I/II-fold pyridoxal phosphate-dependent enzyme, partial [Coxiellaceae bacterium]|nr:aminotransferase class I/II-fold pyridoxal phosphate-dependent enzyme [Coxiellaceae bacterium]